MPVVVQRMGEDLVAEVAAVGRELRIRQRLVAAHQRTGDPAARTALAQTVLDGLYLHVVPVRPEGRQDAAVVGHVAVPVGRALPDAHRGQVRRLQGCHMPLVDAEVGHAVQPDLAVRPRLHTRPLDAVVEVARLPRRERIDEAGRAAGAAGIHPHAGIALGHPFLRVDHFPVLVAVAGPGCDIRVLGDHALPGARITFLEREPLGIGAVGEQHRTRPGSGRAEDVRAQYHAVVHRDRDVELAVHAVAYDAPGCRGCGPFIRCHRILLKGAAACSAACCWTAAGLRLDCCRIAASLPPVRPYVCV